MARSSVEKAVLDPIATVHGLGLRSGHAYAAGFASVGISLAAWLVSRGKRDDSKAQSDRGGIVICPWAPTFFARGLALGHEER